MSKAATENDVFAVEAASSTFAGGAGDDLFICFPRSSGVDGGVGIDTYSAEIATRSAFINMRDGEVFSFFTSTAENIFNFENARGSEFNDEILGNAGANRLEGLGGDDIIEGIGGNDTIFGGVGNDTLHGGEGLDTLVINGTVATKSGAAAAFSVAGTSGGEGFTINATGFEQVLFNGTLMSAARFLSSSAPAVQLFAPIFTAGGGERIDAMLAGER